MESDHGPEQSVHGNQLQRRVRVARVVHKPRVSPYTRGVDDDRPGDPRKVELSVSPTRFPRLELRSEDVLAKVLEH
eukprot:3511699-Rhodomonas_salina.1